MSTSLTSFISLPCNLNYTSWSQSRACVQRRHESIVGDSQLRLFPFNQTTGKGSAFFPSKGTQAKTERERGRQKRWEEKRKTEAGWRNPAGAAVEVSTCSLFTCFSCIACARWDLQKNIHGLTWLYTGNCCSGFILCLTSLKFERNAQIKQMVQATKNYILRK